MSDKLVVLEVQAGVARVALNRPDKLNSFNRAMHAQLRDAFEQIEQDPAIRAVILTGMGRGFCAGQDLADLSFEPGNDRRPRLDRRASRAGRPDHRAHGSEGDVCHPDGDRRRRLPP